MPFRDGQLAGQDVCAAGYEEDWHQSHYGKKNMERRTVKDVTQWKTETLSPNPIIKRKNLLTAKKRVLQIGQSVFNYLSE